MDRNFGKYEKKPETFRLRRDSNPCLPGTSWSNWATKQDNGSDKYLLDFHPQVK